MWRFPHPFTIAKNQRRFAGSDNEINSCMRVWHVCAVDAGFS